MSGPAPWSVKGIDPRAREAAREAARQRGLTIGEWLNQAILANEAALAAARQPMSAPAQPAAEPAEDPSVGLLHQALAQLAERVDANDRRAANKIVDMDRSLAAIGRRLESGAQPTERRVDNLLQELREAQADLLRQMRTLEAEEISGLKSELQADRAQHATHLTTIEENVAQLVERVSGAEAQTGQALAALESTLASLDEKMTQASGAPERTEARLATLAEDFSNRVEDVRAEFAGQIAAAIDDLKPEDTRAALTELSKRIATTERRHAQTIEAVSIEIKRLNEAMERRLRGIEARNDDAAATRDQMREIAESVDMRLGTIEHREAAAFARISDEVGRIADRLGHRVDQAEQRSADAIGQVGEHLVQMAERLQDRQDRLVEEVSDRIADSEYRQSENLNNALTHLSATIEEIEARKASGNPMGEAMAAFADRLSQIEARIGAAPSIEKPAPKSVEQQQKLTPAQQAATPLAGAPIDDARPFIDLDLDDVAAAAELPKGAPDEGLSPLDDDALASHHAALKEMASDLAARVVSLGDGLAPDTIFVEDIEAQFRGNGLMDFPEPAPSGGDDILSDMAMEPPGEDDEDLFWTTGDDTRAPLADDEAGETDPEMFSSYAQPLAGAAADDFLADDLLGAESESEAFRSLEFPASSSHADYLSAARKAAQASALTGVEAAPARRPNTAGRVMFWTAAGATAAALAGGAYYYSLHPERLPDFARASAPRDGLNTGARLEGPPGSIADAARAAAIPAPTHTLAPETPATPLAAPAELAPESGGDEAPVRAGPVTPLVQFVAADLDAMERAAAQGVSSAQYELAMARIAQGETAQAAALLKRAAGNGLAAAQYRLAKLYENGQGVAIDPVAARKLTEQAARAGNSKAMHDYAVLLAGGQGAALDEPGAFQWFKRAAELGVLDSQYNLGILYLHGRGVGPDTAQAYFWFTVAANSGDQSANARAAQLERQLGRSAADALRTAAASFQPQTGDAFANGVFDAKPAQQQTAALDNASS